MIIKYAVLNKFLNKNVLSRLNLHRMSVGTSKRKNLTILS